MAALSPYEELRIKKLEENKRKLEELKLNHLSASLREAIATPKRSPAKSVKRKASEPVSIRRSERVASLPAQPKYQDEFPANDIIRRIRRSNPTRKDLANRVYATDEEREYTIEKATKLENSLSSAFCTFVKPMLQSHVTGGFWLWLGLNIGMRCYFTCRCCKTFELKVLAETLMFARATIKSRELKGLPTEFCRKHMPKKDTNITLIDEDKLEFDTLYLANKRGLSAGWRGFAIEHKLVDGDTLVFQQMSLSTFKVYIIRASGYHDQ